jgi:hypothetical protein
MDELSLFTDLRPAPGRVDVAAARDRLTGAIAGGPARPARRSKRMVVAGGMVAVAAVAAIVVPAVLPRGGGSDLTGVAKAAWTVDRHPDGTITLTIEQLFGDLTGLQKTLRTDGVPAIVAVVPWKISSVNGGTRAIQACGYERYVTLNSEPHAVQGAVITYPATKTLITYANSKYAIAKVVHESPDPFIWIIHPGAMPRASVLFIVASPSLAKAGVGGAVSLPVVLRAGTPVCVPGDDVASQWSSR